MTTTDQQAVPVAQADREAAAKIYELLGFGPCQHIIDGVEDDVSVVQIVARHRLASVSSASAEGASGMKTWLGGDTAPADWNGGRVLFRHGGTSTSRPGEGMCWSHGMLGGGKTDIIAYTPKSEPVPATNQAGEVERLRAALRKIVDGNPTCDSPEAQCQWDAAIASAALATQPATSHETRGTLANPSTFGKPTFGLAATPTPPTLSEDLREALKALERQAVALYRAATPAGNYGANTEGSDANQNAFADKDPAVIKARAALAIMSGAVEGVDRARKLLHESYDSACVETKVWYSEDTVIEAMLEFAARTTPPARSYADGVEDAAKVVKNAAEIMRYREQIASEDMQIEYGPAADALCEAYAAIRLLSQGEKA